MKIGGKGGGQKSKVVKGKLHRSHLGFDPPTGNIFASKMGKNNVNSHIIKPVKEI